MTMDDTLKWISLIFLLLFVHFGSIDNSERQNADGTEEISRDEVYKVVDNVIEETRLPRQTSDEKDIEWIADSMKKKKHTQGVKKTRKQNIKGLSDGWASEKKLTDAVSSGEEDELESGDPVGNPCVTRPCSNGGTCSWNREGKPSFHCSCRLGFRGTRCEQEVQECDAMPCRDRGDCVVTPKGFMCLCKDGYGGKFCEVSHKTHTLVREPGRQHSPGDVVITKETVQDIYISVGVVGGVVGIIALSVCIHCCRVWNKRIQLTEEWKDNIANGGQVTSLPRDVCDISDDLCREFWCCSCADIKKDKTLYDELINEFKHKSSHHVTHVDSPYPHMKHSRRLVQSEGALPVQKHSFRSFKSLPTVLKRPSKEPSWLPERQRNNDTVDYVEPSSPSSSRTRPRSSSPSRKSFRSSRKSSLEIAPDDQDTEGSYESQEIATEIIRDYPSEHRQSSGRVVSECPSHPPRPSVRSILSHLSHQHPPLPNLPSRASRSSSTFSQT